MKKTLSGKVCLGPVLGLYLLIWGQGLSKLTFSPLLAKGQWCTDYSGHKGSGTVGVSRLSPNRTGFYLVCHSHLDVKVLPAAPDPPENYTGGLGGRPGSPS